MADYSILRCPACKGRLSEGEGLRCQKCGVNYPVIGGVPVMLTDAPRNAEQDVAVEKEFYEKMFAGVAGTNDGHCITYGHERVYDFVEGIERGTLLEAGCGGGHNGVNLSKRGFKVTSVDLTLNGITAAQRLAQHERQEILYVAGDIMKLPFADKEFDVCFCSLVLHHFLSLDNLIKELSRVTKKYFVAFEVNAFDPISFMRFNVINPTIGISTIVRNQRALFPGAVKKVLQQNGFREFELQYEDVHHAIGRSPSGGRAKLLGAYKSVMGLLPSKFSNNKFLIRAKR